MSGGSASTTRPSSLPSATGRAAASPPLVPGNWYLAAASSELAPGKIVAHRIGERELVLYRCRAGARPTALAAHCRHAGCHLKHADVISGRLRCPLHHRVIDAAGRFIGRDGTPTDTFQPTLPVYEGLGGVFVFAGDGTPFPFHLPALASTAAFASKVLPAIEITQPWPALIANGMDIDHLAAVHDRRLKEPPSLEQIAPHLMRLAYRTEVTGRHISDRLMKWLSGDDIHGTITCVGGSTILVDARIKTRRTFILLSMSPTAAHGSSIRGIVGVEGDPARVATRLRLAVAAWLFRAFLKKDVGVLEGLRWHPPADEHTLGDRLTRRLHAFFCEQPEAFPTAAASDDSSEDRHLRLRATM